MRVAGQNQKYGRVSELKEGFQLLPAGGIRSGRGNGGRLILGRVKGKYQSRERTNGKIRAYVSIIHKGTIA